MAIYFVRKTRHIYIAILAFINTLTAYYLSQITFITVSFLKYTTYQDTMMNS